jgi:hypothetical protein
MPLRRWASLCCSRSSERHRADCSCHLPPANFRHRHNRGEMPVHWMFTIHREDFFVVDIMKLTCPRSLHTPIITNCNYFQRLLTSDKGTTFILWHLFQIANGGLPCGTITTTVQHTNTQVTYAQNTHIIQKKTTKNKQEISPQNYKNSEGHITANEYSVEKGGGKIKNRAIPDTGFGGLLSCGTSRLSHCLDNRFIVGG